MLREFELRLANVLGSRATAPLAGAIDAAPARNQALVVLSIRRADLVEAELLSIRPERVPGAEAPRRVLKLRCEVAVVFRDHPGGTRVEQLRGFEQILYLLDESSLRDGSALLPDDDSDPGFLIRRMRISTTEVPAMILLDTEGFFWPVGTAGITGPTVREMRIRQAIQPVRMIPEQPRLLAGGPPTGLRIEFGATGAIRVEEGGAVSQRPFGLLLASLIDAGGRPGAGSLTGGADGPEGSRMLNVSAGAADVQYTPPAEPADDRLILRLEDNENGPSIEIGRFILRTRGA